MEQLLTQLETQGCSRRPARWAPAALTLLVLVLQAACATGYRSPTPRESTDAKRRAAKADASEDLEVANLRRAATLPWTDEGRCVVQEASQPWPVLVERCFHALDHDRLEFNDPTGRCTVASAGAAAMGLGVCVLAAPELVVGAIIVTGVVVGFAIHEALEAYEKRGLPRCGPP